jgi:glycosyltransferase involved in cell wall biosynthesis
VDNFSDDETIEIAKKYTEKTYEQWPERTAQKNYGITKAQWTYICFIDSDMRLSPEVIRECVEKIDEDPAIGGLCIPERSIGKGIFVQIRDFERSFYTWTPIESARFFRREEVVAVWGFEEDLIFFEESLLPQKIELQFQKTCKKWIRSYIEHDEGDITLRKWLQKKFYYGESLLLYRKKSQEIGVGAIWATQMSLPDRFMIFLWERRFYTRPLLALGVLWLKTMEFGAWGLGFLFSKFTK